MCCGHFGTLWCENNSYFDPHFCQFRHYKNLKNLIEVVEKFEGREDDPLFHAYDPTFPLLKKLHATPPPGMASSSNLFGGLIKDRQSVRGIESQPQLAVNHFLHIPFVLLFSTPLSYLIDSLKPTFDTEDHRVVKIRDHFSI